MNKGQTILEPWDDMDHLELKLDILVSSIVSKFCTIWTYQSQTEFHKQRVITPNENWDIDCFRMRKTFWN